MSSSLSTRCAQHIPCRTPTAPRQEEGSVRARFYDPSLSSSSSSSSSSDGSESFSINWVDSAAYLGDPLSDAEWEADFELIEAECIAQSDGHHRSSRSDTKSCARSSPPSDTVSDDPATTAKGTRERERPQGPEASQHQSQTRRKSNDVQTTPDHPEDLSYFYFAAYAAARGDAPPNELEAGQARHKGAGHTKMPPMCEYCQRGDKPCYWHSGPRTATRPSRQDIPMAAGQRRRRHHQARDTNLPGSTVLPSKRSYADMDMTA